MPTAWHQPSFSHLGTLLPDAVKRGPAAAAAAAASCAGPDAPAPGASIVRPAAAPPLAACEAPAAAASSFLASTTAAKGACPGSATSSARLVCRCARASGFNKGMPCAGPAKHVTPDAGRQNPSMSLLLSHRTQHYEDGTLQGGWYEAPISPDLFPR